MRCWDVFSQARNLINPFDFLSLGSSQDREVIDFYESPAGGGELHPVGLVPGTERHAS